MAQLLFWCAALLLVHSYFGYPVLLFCLDAWEGMLQSVRFMTRGEDRRAPAAGAWPGVSLVVAAHNEASCIGAKIDNSLSLRYPADRFELLIGSDGSTDGTDEAVRACPDPRVRLVPGPRLGKSAVLNRCIPQARGEVIVLSDANTRVDPEAIERLVRHFRDPSVGAVCGRLKLYNRHRKEYEESLYWTYESLIKLYEGRRGLVMGANGGLYAIRRSLFTELPPETIVDDFVVPLRLLLRGYRVTYEPLALAHEETTEDYQREFGRRARIAAGNFQTLRLVPQALLPSAGFRAFAFWSHKVLRWLAPGLMGVALLSSLALIAHPGYRLAFFAQTGFYALAAAGRAQGGRGTLGRLSSLAYYFVTMNLAIAVGFWRFLRKSQGATWDRTARA